MIKTALFILFVGGFQFGGVDTFKLEKFDGNNPFNCIPAGQVTPTVQQTPAIYRNNEQLNYIMPQYISVKAEVVFIQSKKELLERMKDNREREMLIWDIKHGCTVAYTIEPVKKIWEEKVKKEEIVDYEINIGGLK